MPQYRLDLLVDGDLVLPPGTIERTITSGAFTFTFRNAKPDKDGNALLLAVSVIGPSDDMETANDDLRDALRHQLDFLAYVVRGRFRIHSDIRLIEWTPGTGTRRMTLYHQFDSRIPPAPELEDWVFEMIGVLNRTGAPDFITQAWHSYRLALLDMELDDKFMRLWQALEIVAENIKEKQKVPIECSGCHQPLTCAACGKEQLRAPMAKQAINALLDKIFGECAPDISKRLFIARNGLTHGRRRKSIEDELGCPLSLVVTKLGHAVFGAILDNIKLDLPNDKLPQFGSFDDEFITTIGRGEVTMLIDFKGPRDHPDETEIPKPDFGIKTVFNP
jgi:hypothetical protein